MELPLARILNYVYALWSESLDEEGRARLDNRLTRPPNLQTTAVPGLPIPDWMDLDDLPPGTVIPL